MRHILRLQICKRVGRVRRRRRQRAVSKKKKIRYHKLKKQKMERASQNRTNRCRGRKRRGEISHPMLNTSSSIFFSVNECYRSFFHDLSTVPALWWYKLVLRLYVRTYCVRTMRVSLYHKSILDFHQPNEPCRSIVRSEGIGTRTYCLFLRKDDFEMLHVCVLLVAANNLPRSGKKNPDGNYKRRFEEKEGRIYPAENCLRCNCKKS